MATALATEIVTVDGQRASVLRRRARPVGRVTREIQGLIDRMVATMHEARGMGLAAPQIGEGVRVVVAEVEERTIALVDPEVVHAEGEESAIEACLSVPGVIGEVPRATKLVVRGYSRRGRRVTVRAEGLLARVLQHELDHIDGVLFLDRVRDLSTVRHVGEDDVEYAQAAPATE